MRFICWPAAGPSVHKTSPQTLLALIHGHPQRLKTAWTHYKLSLEVVYRGSHICSLSSVFISLCAHVPLLCDIMLIKRTLLV